MYLRIISVINQLDAQKWPEDGPQCAKHVVFSIINRIQRELCFDLPTPSSKQSFDSAKKKDRG